MEISKLKLELYDLAAIILPGFFLTAEIFALFMGFPWALAFARDIRAAELTLLLLCSFALGNLVQEGGDRLIKRFSSKRFFRQGRDNFWTSDMRQEVCQKIVRLGGPVNPSVDAAFDFCLTCLDGSFAKRDVFLAISDLSRSLWLLFILGVGPLCRTVVYAYGWRARSIVGSEGAVLIAIGASLSWSRMVRFRELSESPVFHSFLAQGVKRDKVEATASDDE